MPTCITVMLIVYASVIIVYSCMLYPSCHEPAVILFSFAYFYFFSCKLAERAASFKATTAIKLNTLNPVKCLLQSHLSTNHQ